MHGIILVFASLTLTIACCANVAADERYDDFPVSAHDLQLRGELDSRLLGLPASIKFYR